MCALVSTINTRNKNKLVNKKSLLGEFPIINCENTYKEYKRVSKRPYTIKPI